MSCSSLVRVLIYIESSRCHGFKVAAFLPQDQFEPFFRFQATMQFFGTLHSVMIWW